VGRPMRIATVTPGGIYLLGLDHTVGKRRDCYEDTNRWQQQGHTIYTMFVRWTSTVQHEMECIMLDYTLSRPTCT
jgi:hypothetical protein